MGLLYCQETEVEVCCLISYNECKDVDPFTFLQQPVSVDRDVSTGKCNVHNLSYHSSFLMFPLYCVVCV